MKARNVRPGMIFILDMSAENSCANARQYDFTHRINFVYFVNVHAYDLVEAKMITLGINDKVCQQIRTIDWVSVHHDDDVFENWTRLA